jgi:hypothetical protein
MRQPSKSFVNAARRWASAWLVAIGVLMVTPSMSQARWFTVELIVFERTSGAGIESELWPEQVEEPRRGLTLSARGDNSVGLLDSGGESIRPVPRGQLAYGNMSARLSRSGRYRSLVHLGWRQRALSRNQALPVSIGGSNSEVRGTVRLYLSRFLHLETHLLYSSPNALGGTPFELVESRRMRSGELHYFDHPVFGMIVRITPYQPPGGEYLPSREPAKPATSEPTEAPVPLIPQPASSSTS